MRLSPFALGAVLTASSVAYATPLTTSQTVTAAPITFSTTDVVASIGGPLTAGTFTGTYSESVIHDADNIFNASCGAAGCLTFVLQVSNDASSANGLEHVTNGDGLPVAGEGFENYLLNAGYSAIEGGAVPLTVDESPYGTVGFNFTGADSVIPGTSTDFLVIETNASNYTLANFAAIDSTTDTVAGYIPAAATPEPSSFLLLGTGLLGVAGAVKRRLA